MEDEREDKRYAVQIDFYIYEKTDSEAADCALGIERKLREKFDNQAKITGLWDKPFGSLKAREIDYMSKREHQLKTTELEAFHGS